MTRSVVLFGSEGRGPSPARRRVGGGAARFLFFFFFFDAREDRARKKALAHTNRRETRCWFRARTALALSSAFTSCTRVLNRPNAQMCCWSSHVTSSALPPCGDERARRGRGSAGRDRRRSFRAGEANAFERKTRARDRPNARPGEGVQGAREAREKSSRDHHARSCWIPARSVSHAPLARCEKCAAGSRACSPSFPVKGKKITDY